VDYAVAQRTEVETPNDLFRLDLDATHSTIGNLAMLLNLRPFNSILQAFEVPELPEDMPAGDPITGAGTDEGGGTGGGGLQLSYYLYDHLGNTRIVFHTELDCGGADPVKYVPEALFDYYPFGKTLRSWTPCDNERYLTTYHERDKSTGYDYRGARYYDSDLGRFLSVDPLAKDYAAWSPYNYVLGNPVIFVDPDGMKVDDYYYDENGNFLYKDNKETDYIRIVDNKAVDNQRLKQMRDVYFVESKLRELLDQVQTGEILTMPYPKLREEIIR
jgi:RHS repeat-associated protein